MEKIQSVGGSLFGGPFNVMKHIEPQDLRAQTDLRERFSRAFERYNRGSVHEIHLEWSLSTYRQLHQDVVEKLEDASLDDDMKKFYKGHLALAEYYIGDILHFQGLNSLGRGEKDSAKLLIEGYALMKNAILSGADHDTTRNRVDKIVGYYSLMSLLKVIRFNKRMPGYVMSFLKFRSFLKENAL